MKFKIHQYRIWLKWFITVLIFACIFYFSLRLFDIHELKPKTIFESVLLNIGIIIMIFIALGAHELGHLLMGLKKGFRFELYVVGFLGIKRKGKSIYLFLNKDFNYFGGVAITAPKDNNHDNAKVFAKILLAGPIASIVFSLICFTLIPIFDNYFGIIIYTGAMVSLAIFTASTVPSRTGIFFTDRKRYQRLIRPGKTQNVELAILKIMGTYQRDNSYKNIDVNDLNILIEDELPFFQFYGLFFLICYQFEVNGFAEEKTLGIYSIKSENIPKRIVNAFEQEIETLSTKN